MISAQRLTAQLVSWPSRSLWPESRHHVGLLQLASFSAGSQAGSLVVAEHSASKLAPNTLHTITAASQLGTPVTLLVAGAGVGAVAESAAAVSNVSKVLLADDACLEHAMPEPMAALVASLQKRMVFSHILAPSSTFGKNFLPRAGALLDTQPVSDVIKVQAKDVFVRPIYAGNALATVQYTGAGPCMLTVRATAFEAAAVGSGAAAPIEAVDAADVATAAEAAKGSVWLKEQLRVSERPDLGSARVVVSGGRALKSAENFAVLERVADLLGGAVGATRAAVDAGMVPNDLQVGQTGKVVAPDLYMALGISGAIQHLAGMKDSKVVVAINTDADAPIFQVSDYGLVMDIFDALPQLEAEIAKVKGT